QPQEPPTPSLWKVLDSTVAEAANPNSMPGHTTIRAKRAEEPTWWLDKSLLGSNQGQRVFVPRSEGEMPPIENSFDLVYCDGLSHVVRPTVLVQSISRILKPGGHVYAIVEAENSCHHWVVQFLRMGLVSGLLTQFSLAGMLSRNATMTGGGA